MKKPYIIEFQIEGLPKTTNASSSSWRARYSEAKRWKYLVSLAILQFGAPKIPLKKAKLTLTRVSSAEPDFDGLVSSFKHATDGLIEAKVIENDKMSNIGQSEYKWIKGKRNEGYIIIKVEEL